MCHADLFKVTPGSKRSRRLPPEYAGVRATFEYSVRTRFCIFAAALLCAGILAADSLREGRKAFLRARTAVSDGRYQEALELYRRALEQLPEDAVVRLEYAELLKDLNVPEESASQAREAVRLDPKMAEAHRLLGSLELAASEKDPKRLEAAIRELTAAQELKPGDIATTVTLARALLARGSPAAAARLLDGLPEGLTQTGLLRLAAEARVKSGRLRDAEEAYRALLTRDPADREAVAALVALYEEADRLDEAISLLSGLEKREPENAHIAERITLDLARAGRFADAESRARDLAARRPENRAIRRLLAQVLFEKGDTAEGEKILRALLAADPEDEAARRALALELARERRFAEARPLFEETARRARAAPAKAEADPTASVDLGYLALLEKDFAATRKLLEPVTVAGREVNARALRILLAVARETEDAAFGLRHARAALEKEPRNAEWTGAVSDFQLRSGEKKSAEAALARLAASEDAEEAIAAADAYSRVKDFTSAARIARDASRRFPESTEALFRLASSLERSGSPLEAEKIFRQLLATRPRDSAAQNYLGYMWADQGVHLEEARGLLEKAVAREPRNGAYLDSLGWVYFRLGRLEAAEKNLREALRREPDDPTIQEHLGDLSEQQGKLEKAAFHWERALELKHEEPDKVRQKLLRSRSRAAVER